MTRLGWGAGTAGLVLLIMGVTARWAPLLVLGAGLFVLVMGAFVYVVRSPRLQLVRSVEPPRVEKGQPAIAVVQATRSACAGGSRPWENRRSFRSIPECCR